MEKEKKKSIIDQKVKIIRYFTKKMKENLVDPFDEKIFDQLDLGLKKLILNEAFDNNTCMV